MNEKDFAYIMVTPAKNEEKSLPKLINSIEDQSIRPLVWFILNDGSNDNTQTIISLACSKHSWIHGFELENNSAYDIEEHYSSICRLGFDLATNFCRERQISYKYIALSDADTFYPNNYFYVIINSLKENKNYGIASGNMLIYNHEGSIYYEKTEIDGLNYPYGTGRVWAKEAFEETEGYMLTKSPDTVSNILSLAKGWKINRVSTTNFYQTRPTCGKINLWDGYFGKGTRYYYVGASLINLFNNVIFLLFFSNLRYSRIMSLAFFCGYISSYLRRYKRIQNREVRNYMGDYRRVLKNYKTFALKLIKEEQGR